MDILVDCSCGQKFQIDKQYVGQAVACPTCGTAVVVPVPVRVPVQLEALPELKAQPIFSSYTLPATRGPSVWSQYKGWVLAAFAIVIFVSLLVAIVWGLVWLSSAIEPPAPSQSGEPPAGESSQQPGAQPATGAPITGAPGTGAPSTAAPPATSADDDSEDFEGDSMPPAKEAPPADEP